MMDELNALLEASKKVELNDGSQKIPDGDYEAVVESVGFTESKNTGNSMIKWEYNLTRPIHVK